MPDGLANGKATSSKNGQDYAIAGSVNDKREFSSSFGGRFASLIKIKLS